MSAPPAADPAARVSSRAALFGLSLVLVLSTLFLAWAVPLTPGRMAHPAATLLDRLPFWSFLESSRPSFLRVPLPVAALLLLACGGSFAACAGAVRLLWGAGARRDLVAIVLGTGALCTTITLFAPPNLNSNLWNYMLRARLASVHGFNPYTHTAAEFPDDPLYPYANPSYTGTPGGKLAAVMVFEIAFTRLGGDDPVRTLMGYRGGLLLFSFANLLLLAAAARRAIPHHAAAGMALWAWNPIVIMNSLARADTVMLFWLLLGTWLLLAGHRRLAVIPLTLSVHVKLITAPLLGVAALAEARHRRWKELAIAALLAVLTTVLIWAPFYDRNAIDLISRYAQVAGNAEGSVHGPLKMAALAGFALVLLAVGLTRRRDERSLLEGWVLVQIYFSLFLAKFASADYLLSLIALVGLTMGWRSVFVTFALGLSYFLFDQWYLVGAPHFPMPDLFPFSRTVVFLLPPTAAALFFLAWLVRRRFRTPSIP